MRLKRFFEHNKAKPTLSEVKDYLSDLIDDYSCEIEEGTDMMDHASVELLGSDDVPRLSVLLRMDPQKIFSFKIALRTASSIGTTEFGDQVKEIVKQTNETIPSVASAFGMKFITRSTFVRLPIKGFAHPGVAVWELFFQLQ